MTKLCPFNAHVPKWHLAYFVPIDGHFGQIVRYGLQFFLPDIYINFDIKTNFKVNQTQVGHFIPKNTPKITKIALSQNSILRKCHSPKSLLLLHFSMNLSETLRINVNMDFVHTNGGRFLI